MIEDNPFYTVNFVDNDENQNPENQVDSTVQNSDETTTQTINETQTSVSEDANTTELQRDSVQQPEGENTKTEEVKSTGVSSYTEVPSINKETAECNTNILSVMDKFNMCIVFAFVVWVLISFKKKKFAKIVETTTNFLFKHSGIINIALLGMAFCVFCYPKFFSTGISGKLDLFTMLEFASVITINAIVLTFLSIKFLRTKKLLFKKPKTFSGILFLEKSLITFSLSGLLFFLFTESQIALSLLYFFIILSSIFFFMQKDDEEFSLYAQLYILTQSIQIVIIGMTTGLYPIILFGALLIGYTH